ncbi:MAG: pyroglutamyl-peptidase I [Alphaproteobacteria bacterium]|nr:pyroglutamyl-peptidase I [Alphaproteobacteria bacterium]
MADVLVTGFEPFGGGDRNPSQEIARAVDGTSVGGGQVTGRVLPVSMRRLADALRQALDETRPRLIVSLGLAGGESMVRLERLGVNLADFPFGDNDGRKSLDEAIAPGGPAAFPTTLPNRAILNALLAAGIPARLSDTAGTYLCNACIYLTGKMLAERAAGAPFGFIHLPYMPEQVAALVSAGSQPEQMASMPLALMARATELAIETALQSNVTIARAASRS